MIAYSRMYEIILGCHIFFTIALYGRSTEDIIAELVCNYINIFTAICVVSKSLQNRFKTASMLSPILSICLQETC